MFSPMFSYTISIITLFYFLIEKTEGFFLLDYNSENYLMPSSITEDAIKGNDKFESVRDLLARDYLQKISFIKTITRNPSSTTQIKRLSSSTTAEPTTDPSLTTEDDEKMDTSNFEIEDFAIVKRNGGSDQQSFAGALSHFSEPNDVQYRPFLRSSTKSLSSNRKNPSTLSEQISSSTHDGVSKISRLKFKKKRFGVSTKTTNSANSVTENPTTETTKKYRLRHFKHQQRKPSESGRSPAGNNNSKPAGSKSIMRFAAKLDKKSTVNKKTPTMTTKRERISNFDTFVTMITAATIKTSKTVDNGSWKFFVPIRSCGGFIGTAPSKSDRSNFGDQTYDTKPMDIYRR